jgi:hypothetical protein
MTTPFRIVATSLLAGLLSLGTGLSAEEPADAEIARLVREDQAARTQDLTMDLGAIAAQIRDDKLRRTRAALVYLQDEIKDPTVYADVAVLFQHGDLPDDCMVARELSLLAAFHGRSSGLAACAEDRLLLRLNRPQRFGTQCQGGPPALAPGSVERGPWAVTDRLRADFMVPPLALALQKGPEAAAAAAWPAINAHLEARRNPAADSLATLWFMELGKSEVHDRLAALKRLRPSQANRARIRAALSRLHRRGGLWLPSDYADAAELLLGAGMVPSQFLLANEWAAVAVMRGHSSAWSSFARSWDRYAQSIGQAGRYGTITGFMASSVGPALRRELAGDKGLIGP